MSNLSELLPTGGGQNAVDFVASGTLSSGQTVVLNSDGTVEAVAETSIPQVVGSPRVFRSARTENISAAFDPSSNKVVIAYRSVPNSNYGFAIVGTVSGTSISFGSPVVFYSGTAQNMSAIFDSSANKVVIAFSDGSSSDHGTAIVGTVSGTSISFGTKVVFESASTAYISATFDSNSNKVVIAYADNGNSVRGTAVVGTVSGTSISFGGAVVFGSAATPFISATYDSNSNKVVIAYRDNNNASYGTAVVGTVSGTTISYGTPVVFHSTYSNYNTATFDSNSNKIVIAFAGYNGSNYECNAIVGTVSGTSISFGTKAQFDSNDNPQYISATFDSNANKVVIAYRDTFGYGSLAVGDVSGTSISFDSPVTFESASSENTAAVFDSNLNKVVIAYRDMGNSQYGTSVVFQNAYTSTNSADFIGITAEAISDTATGPVNVYGGINEAQTGLTIGADYYVQDDGSLSTTASSVKVGQAISATTINMMDLT